MKIKFSVLATIFATVLSSSVSAAVHITIANTTQANTPMSKTMTEFKERLEKISNNEIAVQTSFGGALGNDAQLLQKSQIGSQIQAAQTSGANLGTVVDAFKVFDVPFLLRDAQQSNEMLYPNGHLSGEIVDRIQGFLAKKNLRLLYALPFEFRGILSNTKSVTVASDVKGVKFRVTPNPVERAIIESWGAAGTTMGISEVYTSLQTGTVDALAIPPLTAKAFALNEVAKSFTNLNFQAHPTFVVINKRFWDKLSDKERDMIQKAADEAVMATKELHYKAIINSLDAFANSGATVIQPTKEQLDTFKSSAVTAASNLVMRSLKEDELKLLDLIKSKSAM